jgi:hypothetical protein
MGITARLLEAYFRQEQRESAAINMKHWSGYRQRKPVNVSRGQTEDQVADHVLWSIDLITKQISVN